MLRASWPDATARRPCFSCGRTREGPAALGHVCEACAGLLGDLTVETGLGTRKVYAKADLVEGWRLGARSGRPEDLRLRAPSPG